MSGRESPDGGLQSWNDPGQNRESGGTTSEQTPYAPETEATDSD